MDKKIAQLELSVTKVVIKSDNWYGCRQECQRLKNGPQRDRVRALGRYEVAGEQLAESVSELRAADAAVKASEVHHG